MTAVLALAAAWFATLALLTWLDRVLTREQNAPMRHCRDTALHVPAQRDRRADLPPWLFDADPCAERWPDGGAVVVDDWDALGGGS